jgi:hypothetical protein
MMRLGRMATLLLALSLLTSAATAHAASTRGAMEDSYEVWVDSNKDSHRRDVAWRKVSATTAKSDCDDRRVREARAEYYTLTGQGVPAAHSGRSHRNPGNGSKDRRGACALLGSINDLPRHPAQRREDSLELVTWLEAHLDRLDARFADAAPESR